MLNQKHDNLFFYPYNKLKGGLIQTEEGSLTVDLKVKSDEQENYKNIPV